MGRLVSTYERLWTAWEQYESRAAKAGSGATREQMTGAAMMLSWLTESQAPITNVGESYPPTEDDYNTAIQQGARWRDLFQRAQKWIDIHAPLYHNRSPHGGGWAKCAVADCVESRRLIKGQP